MKYFWAIGVFFGMLAIGVWVEAIDVTSAYQNANAAASSMYDSAWNTASSAYGAAKSAASYAKESIKSTAANIRGYVSDSIKALISSQQSAIIDNPYKNSVAMVRVGNGLHAEERAYLAKRKPKVKVALEKMLKRSLNGKYIPNIAIVASGGGYRAMLGTIGSLLAAERIGLLDATTYIAGLSGGTWALGAWVSTGLSLSNFKKYIQKNIETDIHVASVREAKNIFNAIAVKAVYDEPVTIVDIYGGLLANRLLAQYGENNPMVYLSQQAKRVMTADIPYPIYTAIDARQAVADEPHWFEFTPHEIGCAYYGAYIPTWGYGRLCNEGRSQDFAPEQSLGFQMGTFGSAFGVHFGRAWDEIVEKIPGTIIKSAIEKKFIDPNSGKRITSFWAEVFNYMYGMPGQELKDRPTLKLVDAGIDFNLPYPPVSGERPERKADIMVFLDFSGGSLIYSLKKTESYARKKGLKFPPIDYTDVDKKVFSVFRDPADPSAPVVLYFPRLSNAVLWQEHKEKAELSVYKSIEGFDFNRCQDGDFCDTPNFKYSAQQSEKLIDQMEFNIMVHKDKIIEVINSVIDQKSSAPGA
jgi:cytosolic phospholipase A2